MIITICKPNIFTIIATSDMISTKNNISSIFIYMSKRIIPKNEI